MLLDKLPWINKAEFEDDISVDDFLHLWVTWLIHHEFVKAFPPRRGYIVLRPVDIHWVLDADIDYFATLFRFDPRGNTVFVDSCWAPGLWSTCLDVVRATRRKYVAWNHLNRLYVAEMSELSGETPIKSQLSKAFVHNILDVSLRA